MISHEMIEAANKIDHDEALINKLPEEILERIFSYTSQYT